MKSNAELKLVRVDNSLHSEATDIGPDAERSWFEFDRGMVLRHLDDLNDAIEANANELRMVAAEGVFDKSLSDVLLRTSRTLRTIANGISTLRSQVTQAATFPGRPRKKK